MKLPVEIGSMLAGKYRIERVIGQGGMGVVVAATHDELDQRVAIKFLSPEGAKGSEWIVRFGREAKTAAKIKNEHAVKVFDVGKLETGIPYMVMEFLEGRNLDEIIEERRTLPIDEAAEYILQACEALAEAHLVGIVHRDLKPANLFVTHRSDGTICVKILDFGISKIDESLASGGAVTHTTSLVGSPLYMSPERLRGAKDVDRRADIWSLGVMLQEMVTGSPPFLADTIPEIHALVLTTTPTPLHRGCPHAPAALEALILKCLEKTTEARFQNVLEFAQALGAIAPESQGSVERIARITVGGSGPRARLSTNPSASGSFPPAPASSPLLNPRLAVTAAVDELADSGELSAPRAPIPPSRESLPVLSATGKRTGALTSSTGKVALLGAALVVACVVLVVAVRKHGQVRASSPSSSNVAVTHAPTPLATEPEVTAATIQKENLAALVVTDPTTTTNAEPKAIATTHRGHVHARDAASSASAVASASATPPPATATATSNGTVIDYGGRN